MEVVTAAETTVASVPGFITAAEIPEAPLSPVIEEPVQAVAPGFERISCLSARLDWMRVVARSLGFNRAARANPGRIGADWLSRANMVSEQQIPKIVMRFENSLVIARASSFVLVNRRIRSGDPALPWAVVEIRSTGPSLRTTVFIERNGFET